MMQDYRYTSRSHIIALKDGSIHEGFLITHTVEEWVEFFKQTNPTAEIAGVYEISDFPKDRTFRKAWRHCPQNGIRHCMATARDIQRDRLRDKRAPRFTQTDIAIARGLAENKDTTAIAQMAQRLRDVTKHPAIEEAQTVEDLAKVWPSVLDEPVPALGGPRISGDADYDTKALEEWAKGLTEKVSALHEAQTQGVQMRDIQHALSSLDSLRQRLSVMEDKQKMHDERLLEAAKRVDFVMKEGGGRAELTQEELS